MTAKEPLNLLMFTQMGNIKLRQYQKEAAKAVIDSVLNARGHSIVVMFPRQSGKNELQAQIEAYLLYTLRDQPAEIVKISPTWKPQSLNAMRRLERVLQANLYTQDAWSKESGYIFRLGSARMTFFSGMPESNIVGATATHLLEVDEAQDVPVGKFDTDIAPMAASTNATRVFWGTAWTAQTLLARELRAARAADPPLAFVTDADRVAEEVPAYGLFVSGQIARLGRAHPSIRTQYFAEEIDGQAGMFPPERIARMFAHPPRPAAEGAPRGQTATAMLLDVAGEEETDLHALEAGPAAGGGSSSRRDATALTVVAADLSTLGDPLLRAPTYRMVERRLWVGVRHADLYGELRGLAARWNARHLVIDATGIGAGLASFLERALPGRVVPFVFSAASKSRLGWDFLALVDSGRWQEPHFTLGSSGEQAVLQAAFLRQLELCQSQAQPGPAHSLRWGVPDGTRDPLSGEHIHDDLIISAALACVLDGLDWRKGSLGPPAVVPANDPLKEMRGF